MSEIKVSVIIPIYNVEEYLKECLDSLVNQTLNGIEVLMVNDGSTDTSGEIAESYAKKYPNFYLETKSNGGQGQARNYAISHAKGEYITFLDADDYVSEDAYEKMYQMSENGKIDIITGNVKRFNSKKCYNSSLHIHVFKDNIKNTHIIKNPELIYDTTSCNKLFKLEFWKENNLKFPEGVLYEDIPLTIIAYFKSKSTTILKDFVYYWRVREGLTKSTTQQRADINNFLDRLYCLKVVDKFFEENVQDETCRYFKYFKWLDLDLKLYINLLNTVDENYINQFIAIVQEYIKNIPKYVFDDLMAINRIKYYFVEKGDVKSLLQVIDYEKNKIGNLKVCRKGDKFFGKFPFKGIPYKYFEMTKELNNSFEVSEIDKINISEGILDINGYIFIRRVNFDNKDKINLKAKLVNICNGNELEINIKSIKNPYITQKFGVRAKFYKLKNRIYNYDWAGYNINIDLNNPKFLKLNTGIYKIIVTLQIPGIKRDIILSSSNKKIIQKPYLAYYHNISFDYNGVGNLCFFVTEKHSGITNSYFKNNNLNIEGWFDSSILKNQIMICGINGKIKIHLTPIKKNNYKFKDIIQNKFQYAEGFTVIISNALIKGLGIGKWLLMHCKGNKKEILIGNDLYYKNILNNYLFKFYVSKSGKTILLNNEIKTCLKSLKWEKNSLKIVTYLNKNSLKKDQKIFDSKLKCLSIKNGKTIYIKKEDVNLNFLENTFIIKVNDEIGNNIFENGIWKFFVEYNIGSDIISHEITVINDKNFRNKNFTTHSYLPCTLKGYLGLSVNLIWLWESKTPEKREFLERYIYSLMRFLPINKKRIVFESYWRDKYDGNPKYFYEYINKNHPEYECIWIFNDETVKIKGNGKKVRYQTLKYYFYMATSKYFVNNVNFPDFYKKRNNTIEIQTLHGTPLKKMGLDVPDEFETKYRLQRFIRRCKRWDYLIVSNDKTMDIAKKSFLFDKEFLKVNYPTVNEIMRINTSKTINKIKKELKIPENKKVILYAPTWRLKNKFDLMLDLIKMKEILGDEYLLLLRVHPFSVKGLNRTLLNNFVIDVTGYESIEKLYIISDILITDYSSAIFDFSYLNKPIIFFAYDLVYYKYFRGFNIDFEKEAPGPIVLTSDEVIDEVIKSNTIRSRYNKEINLFKRNYLQYGNMNSCKYIVDKVFQ